LLWPESIVPVIRNARSSTGCSSIALTSFFKNMRLVPIIFHDFLLEQKEKSGWFLAFSGRLCGW